MAEQGRVYNETVQDEAKKDALMPPHVYVFGGVLQTFISCGQSIGAKNVARTFADLPPEDKAEMVRVCRLDRTFRSDRKKILLHVERTPARVSLLGALRQTGAEHRQGRAPRSNLERELQEWLEAFSRT